MAGFFVIGHGVPARAQAVPLPERIRMVSREEGEIIVKAAWELRKGLNPKPDCSHFVNSIYAQAGLDYEYASSGDIYEGIDAFERVQTPQPGDLVVWQGHIGIVVDPEEHSFYSSVLSGFAIQDYRSDYWIGRGRPRFYRYLVDREHSARLLAATRSLQVKADSVSMKPKPLRDAAPLEKAGPHPLTPDAEGKQTAAIEIPVSVFVSLRKPSKDDLQAAILKAVDANGERLFRNAGVESHPQIAVADEFKVVKISIHDRSGWADVEVKETVSIQYGKPELKTATEKWRITLWREPQGWYLLPPQEPACLRRDLAIRALSNHLALASKTQGNQQEMRNTVKVLDKLLAEKAAYNAAVTDSR